MYTKTVGKFLHLFLCFSLLFQSMAPAYVYAEEISPTPTPIQELTPTPSAEPTAQPTPTEIITPTPDVTPPAIPVTPTADLTATETATHTPEISSSGEPTSTPTSTVSEPEASNPDSQAPPQENTDQNNSSTSQTSSSPTPEVTPTPTPNSAPSKTLDTILQQEQVLDPNSSPTITTDKTDYFPTDVVHVSGTGFNPSENYILHIYSSDTPAVSFIGKTASDTNGNFKFDYQLDGNYRPKYAVDAFDSSEKLVASYSFTDTDWPLCGFQCKAGDVDVTKLELVDLSNNPITSCSPGSTVNVKIRGTFYNNTNSDRTAVVLLGDVYQGSTLIQHLSTTVGTNKIDGECVSDTIPKNTYTTQDIHSFSWTCGDSVTIKNLTLSWDTGNATCAQFFNAPSCSNRTTKCYSSTSFSVAAPLVANFSTTNVCQGVATSFTDETTGGTKPYSYNWNFGDSSSNSTSQNPTHTYANVGTYSVTNNVTDSTSPTPLVNSITKTVNVNSCAICGDGVVNQTSEQCDDGNTNDTDACSNTCTINTGNIVVHKDVLDPDGNATSDSTVFKTLLDGTNSQNISDGGTVTYPNINTGAHTISEDTLPLGYTQDSITSGGNITVTTGNNDVYIVNKQSKANLTVVKVVKDTQGNVITTDDTHFTANVGQYSGSIYQGHDAIFPLNPGTYSVTESANTNYDQLGCKLPTGADATDFTLSSGGSLTVTCTNKQKTATISVYKNVYASDGITDVSDPNIFSVTLNGETKNFSEGHPAVFTVNPGTYSAVEDAGTNYLWMSQDGSVNIFSNGTGTININNKQKAGLISGYKYDTTSGLGIAGWTINLSGATNLSTTTDSTGFYQFMGLITGLYTVSEAQPTGWTPTEATSHNVTIDPGTESVRNNFTNFKNISITACKQIDTDGSLETTTDRSNRSGWDVTLSNGTTTDTKTTGENGCYTWTDKGPGSYSVFEETPTGWTTLAETTHNFGTAQSGKDLNYTFVNFDNGYISGHKFNDLNGNGVWDKTTEPAISGWIISALYPDGKTHTRTTNSDGYYIFSDLGPGSYTVSENGQTNWNNTTPTSGHFDIQMTSGGEFPNNDFGNRGQGTITVHKDVLGTTIGLSNFCFTLSPDPSIGEVCANADGNAVFSNVPSGTYTASETKTAPNYTQTASTCDTTMTLTNGGDSASCTVTNTRDQGTITFEKVVDDGSDISAWSFGIRGIEGTFRSGDTVTLDTGSYSVNESGSTDYSPLSVSGVCSGLDGTSATLNVTKSGGTCTFTNNVNKGTIIINKTTNPSKWDGTFDFTLNKGESLIDETSIGDGQSHSFTGLFPGSYSLAENHEGWDLTAGCYDNRENKVDPSNITLSPGGTITCDFTNTKYGSISGYKWKDLNGDRERSCTYQGEDERQVCEDKLSNWRIFIDTNKNGILDNEETYRDTNDSGDYQFTNLLPGTYSVCEVQQTGWTNTYPAETKCHSVQLSAGDERGDINFGNRQVDPVLTISKFNTANTDKTPGSSVDYHILLEVEDANINGLTVKDLLPKGFVYRSGSYQVLLNGSPFSIPFEPVYHSPGTWKLGNFNVGDKIELIYTADIASDQQPGYYLDSVWAQGISLSNARILANADPVSKVDDNFAGTSVNVVKDQTNGETYNVEKKVEVVGQVLGASTDLPATGSNQLWLAAALLSLYFGVKLVRSSKQK